MVQRRESLVSVSKDLITVFLGTLHHQPCIMRGLLSTTTGPETTGAFYHRLTSGPHPPFFSTPSDLSPFPESMLVFHTPNRKATTFSLLRSVCLLLRASFCNPS
jgi:hypothetical protein